MGFVSNAESLSSVGVGLFNSIVGAFCMYAYACKCLSHTDSKGNKETVEFNLPKFFMSIYLIVFGLMVIMCGIPSLRKRVTVAKDGQSVPPMGFLGTLVTRAIFILFVGSLGLSLGSPASFAKKIDTVKYLPFLAGIATLAHAFIFSFAACCANLDSSDSNEESASLTRDNAAPRPPSLTNEKRAEA